MGSIITVASYKGGGGKTALTTILAGNLVAQGYKTAVIDADPNRSFYDWFENNYEGRPFTCIPETDDCRVIDKANDLANDYEVVLIDTAGFRNVTAQTAMSGSDMVLIPVMADSGTVRECMNTADKVRSLERVVRHKIPFAAVKSRWDKGGQAEKAAVDDLQAAEVPMLKQHISNLVEIKKMSFSGQVPTVGRIGSEADRIVDELRAFGVVPQKPEGKGRE